MNEILIYDEVIENEEYHKYIEALLFDCIKNYTRRKEGFHITSFHPSNRDAQKDKEVNNEN